MCYSVVLLRLRGSVPMTAAVIGIAMATTHMPTAAGTDSRRTKLHALTNRTKQMAINTW